MSSSEVGEAVPGASLTYAASLRIRHPCLDPAKLTDTLRITPAHCWKAGEPRRSQSGSPLGGQHRDSYWSAPLLGTQGGAYPLGSPGMGAYPLETFLRQQLLHLGRHREFLQQLQTEGGEISLLIELSPAANGVLTLSSTLSRGLADLNIEVELQFVAE
ncbi:MAG TPA: hypothetical protein VJQ47_15250 [Steroidobacteraceae bacterium]|nr:hypothetical protein [Steroidobacteraceae bacterium]